MFNKIHIHFKICFIFYLSNLIIDFVNYDHKNQRLVLITKNLKTLVHVGFFNLYNLTVNASKYYIIISVIIIRKIYVRIS